MNHIKAVPHNLLFDYCGFPLHLAKMTLEVRFSQNAGEDFKDRTETNQPVIASYALLHKNHWDSERAKRHTGWARLASRVYYAPFARRINASLPNAGNEPVLVDLGTGPGILAIEVHKILPRAKIIGVDPSHEMLEIARRSTGESGMDKFDARLGRAEEIPVESDSVDLVFSQFSFHEWQDQAKGLEEVFRILKQSGCIVLRDFNARWFSGWRRNLIKLLCTAVGESYEVHLEMFRFNFDDVTSFLKRLVFVMFREKERTWLCPSRR